MENHNYENEGQFQRKMTSRHLFMLSLGGVIGTGLFLSSGYTIAQAGPLGAILSYLVGAVVVYLVMLSLGELAVAMPVTGSFHTYATKFISPGTGFTVSLALLDLLDGCLGDRIPRCGHADATLVSVSSGLDFCSLLCLSNFGD